MLKDKKLLKEKTCLIINNSVSIPFQEIELSPIRAQGAGGQNVNKVSSAIHLKFDIINSSLPDFYKEKIMGFNDARISKDGVVVIKAQEFRTQEKNKQAAMIRLKSMILDATKVMKKRKPTKPSFSAKKKRVDKKVKQGKKKALRGKFDY